MLENTTILKNNCRGEAKTLIFAVCTYRLVMISIERSETAKKSALEI